MTKTLKRLLCALMAVAMVFCFAACGDKEDKKKDEATTTTTTTTATEAPAKTDAPEPTEEPAKDKSAEAEAAVMDYVEETFAVLESDEMIEELATEIATMVGGEATQEGIDACIPVAKSIMSAVLDSLDIETEVIGEEDGKYEIELTMSIVDYENVDAEAVMMAVAERANEMEANGEVEGLSDEELNELAMELIEEEFKAAFKDAGKTEDSGIVYAEEVDGEWVISD